LAGVWRKTYAINAVIALYLNVFVLIAQLFDKVPTLPALAPTKTEAPFKEAQLATLVAFVVLSILAAIKFQSEPVKPAIWTYRSTCDFRRLMHYIAVQFNSLILLQRDGSFVKGNCVVQRTQMLRAVSLRLCRCRLASKLGSFVGLKKEILF
jgi:hypothetical protein